MSNLNEILKVLTDYTDVTILEEFFDDIYIVVEDDNVKNRLVIVAKKLYVTGGKQGYGVELKSYAITEENDMVLILDRLYYISGENLQSLKDKIKSL